MKGGRSERPSCVGDLKYGTNRVFHFGQDPVVNLPSSESRSQCRTVSRVKHLPFDQQPFWYNQQYLLVSLSTASFIHPNGSHMWDKQKLLIAKQRTHVRSCQHGAHARSLYFSTNESCNSLFPFYILLSCQPE